MISNHPTGFAMAIASCLNRFCQELCWSNVTARLPGVRAGGQPARLLGRGAASGAFAADWLRVDAVLLAADFGLAAADLAVAGLAGADLAAEPVAGCLAVPDLTLLGFAVLDPLVPDMGPLVFAALVFAVLVFAVLAFAVPALALPEFAGAGFIGVVCFLAGARPPAGRSASSSSWSASAAAMLSRPPLAAARLARSASARLDGSPVSSSPTSGCMISRPSILAATSSWSASR